jgi:hypothetical protein
VSRDRLAAAFAAIEAMDRDPIDVLAPLKTPFEREIDAVASFDPVSALVPEPPAGKA